MTGSESENESRRSSGSSTSSSESCSYEVTVEKVATLRELRELRSSASASSAGENLELLGEAHRRGADGKVQTFVCWQDARGVGGYPQRKPQAELSQSDQQLLQDAVKQRVNQLCMSSYTASFQRRQVLRFGEGPAAASGYATGRRQVAEEAIRFNHLYALAQASIEGRLSFDPPQRANSVALGQVVRCMQERRCSMDAMVPSPGMSHAMRPKHMRCTSGYV
mmetsp:Transcript_46512/g.101212  ORF Transcript_46512/g.101212 Transcript_46512/m.101212 type:complete len:222 (-) Transcript_46512:27-692(-)